MTLDELLRGIYSNINDLKKAKKYPNDHSVIDVFQEDLTNWLNLNTSTHSWEKEKVYAARTERDKIDIYGTPKSNRTKNPNDIDDSEWIIEIDATRGDQVAKKMLSRFALWALGNDKPITYIAVLYPDTQNGRSECKKFINFGNDIIKRINKNSKVIGIILGRDKKDRNSKSTNSGFIVDDEYIEVVDPNATAIFEINYKSNTSKGIRSMGQCAKTAILMYAAHKPISNYDNLSKAFDKYIASVVGPSRYSPTRLILNGNVVHTYTQFRRYGNWLDFINLCVKLGIQIDNLNCWYTASGYQYDKAYIHY